MKVMKCIGIIIIGIVVLILGAMIFMTIKAGKDHKIIRIDILRHENGRGSKAEEITKEMVKQNAYDVDAVSGATLSSKVMKSAINDALLQGVINYE